MIMIMMVMISIDRGQGWDGGSGGVDYSYFILIFSLKHIEREWKAFVEEYTSSDIMLANCIAAAAFLTYCGPLGVDGR